MILAGILELTEFMSWIYVPLILSHKGMPPDIIGYVYGLTVVAHSIETLIGRYLVDKYGAYKTIVIDCLTSAPPWLIIGLVTNSIISATAFIINELIVFSPLAMLIAVLESADENIRATVRGGFLSMVEVMAYNIYPIIILFFPYITTSIFHFIFTILAYPFLYSSSNFNGCLKIE